MKTITATRVLTGEPLASLLNKKVDDHSPMLIEEYPTMVVDSLTNNPVLLLAKGEPEDSRILTAAAVEHSKHYGGGVVRAGGMRSRSATFGFSGPAPQMQRPAPTASAWAYQNPEGHAVIANYAATLHKVLNDYGPAEIVARHSEVKQLLHPDWRLGNTCWTSGIVNDTANLYYHYDKNNVLDTWSAMIVLRAGVSGGFLHVADYDLTLPCNHGDILYFAGMSLVHGVTPIRVALPGGYRYSIVYYSIKKFLGMPASTVSVENSQSRQSVLGETLLERQRKTGLLNDKQA